MRNDAAKRTLMYLISDSQPLGKFKEIGGLEALANYMVEKQSNLIKQEISTFKKNIWIYQYTTFDEFAKLTQDNDEKMQALVSQAARICI